MDPIRNNPSTFLPTRSSGIPTTQVPAIDSTPLKAATLPDAPFFISKTHPENGLFSECRLEECPSAFYSRKFLTAMSALAKKHNCRILQVIDQTNDKFNHPKIPTPDGRCHSISAIHAYSELHEEPEIWRAYADPSNRHQGFSMIQRGGHNSAPFVTRQIDAKLAELRGRNAGTVLDLIRTWWPGSAGLSTSQQRTFKCYVDELLYKRRLSYVPGARAVTHLEMGEQRDLARMISSLEPGVHLLKLQTPNDGSHMLSCFIANRHDRPSRLVEPNACEWEGEPDNLGALLQAFWLSKNLIAEWCGSGRWEQLTYRLGIDIDPAS